MQQRGKKRKREEAKEGRREKEWRNIRGDDGREGERMAKRKEGRRRAPTSRERGGVWVVVGLTQQTENNTAAIVPVLLFRLASFTPPPVNIGGLF